MASRRRIGLWIFPWLPRRLVRVLGLGLGVAHFIMKLEDFAFTKTLNNMFTKTKYFQFIDKTFAEMRELIEKKNNDYTAGSAETDPFRNFREAEQFGIDPLAGLSNRMNDKFNRIKSFCATGKLAVQTEGVEDAFHDMIGYSLLALGMLEEQKNVATSDDRQGEFNFTVT